MNEQNISFWKRRTAKERGTTPGYRKPLQTKYWNIDTKAKATSLAEGRKLAQCILMGFFKKSSNLGIENGSFRTRYKPAKTMKISKDVRDESRIGII